MILFSHLRTLLIVSLLITLISCGGGGGGGDDSGGSGASGASDDGSGYRTICGVVTDGMLRNSVRADRGEEVTLESISDSNLLTVSNGDKSILVKLQGIGDTLGFSNTQAKKSIERLLANGARFFPTGCTAVVLGGTTAAVGQLVTPAGDSLTEELLDDHLTGVIETGGTCGEPLLASCYQQIVDNNHKNTEPVVACDEDVPTTIRYRPSDTDCGGNAGVTVTGSLADLFSMQLRYPDGSDRLDPDCEKTDCTPYKVQDYIRGEDVTVGCFGAPGNAVVLSDLAHVSIKRSADDHEPPRFCIADPTEPVN